MSRYSVLVIPEPEVGGFSVVVPTLPGCFSQGRTIEEAVTNVREAIECHLEGLRLDGEPIPAESAPPVLRLVDVA